MVIKENKGSFGEQVYLVNSYYEAVDKIKEIGHHEFYYAGVHGKF